MPNNSNVRAFGVAVNGEISAAYLLAATTATAWDQQYRGTELFDRTTTDTLDLRERFIDWWRKWERESYQPPSVVPSRFASRPVCRVRFQVAQVPWELRLAALSLDGDEQIAWPTTLA